MRSGSSPDICLIYGADVEGKAAEHEVAPPAPPAHDDIMRDENMETVHPRANISIKKTKVTKEVACEQTQHDFHCHISAPCEDTMLAAGHGTSLNLCCPLLSTHHHGKGGSSA